MQTVRTSLQDPVFTCHELGEPVVNSAGLRKSLRLGMQLLREAVFWIQSMMLHTKAPYLPYLSSKGSKVTRAGSDIKPNTDSGLDIFE